MGFNLFIELIAVLGEYTRISQVSGTRILIVTLFMIEKNWKQPKCPSMGIN